MKKQSGIWFVMVAACLSLVIATMRGTSSISSLSGVANVLALMLACLAVLWIHELGHVLFARMVGLNILGVNLWPYYLDLQQKPRWRVGQMDSWLNEGFFRLKGIEGARGKLLVSLLGGSIASASLAILAYQLQAPYEWQRQSFWSMPSHDIGIWMYVWVRFIGFTSWLSAAYLVFQMLPLREYSPTWDGAFVYDLVRGGESCRRAVNQFAFHTEMAEKRPRDWDPMRLAGCREDKPMIDRLNWIWWNYQYHLDRGELEDAKSWVDLGVETWETNRSLDANILRTERVYLYLRLNVDGFDVEEAFGHLSYPRNWWFSWNRAKIAMLIRNGEVKEALYYASCGVHALKGHEKKPLYALEADLFALLMSECVAASAKEAAVEPGV